MPYTNPPPPVMQKTFSMMATVPQVMSTRIWMYTNPNPMTFFEQQQEYQLMFAEKHQAFVESIQDVNQQIFNSHATITNEMIKGWQGIFCGQPYSFNTLHKHIEKETLKIIDSGITPYSRRVKANNQRLNG